MPVPPREPWVRRTCILRCRLSYALWRIRQLEDLLHEHEIKIPDTVVKVPPPSHDCYSRSAP
jgi:hypothetical protein